MRIVSVHMQGSVTPALHYLVNLIRLIQLVLCIICMMYPITLSSRFDENNSLNVQLIQIILRTQSSVNTDHIKNPVKHRR